jgi:hypothetical protein
VCVCGISEDEGGELPGAAEEAGVGGEGGYGGEGGGVELPDGAGVVGEGVAGVGFGRDVR